MQRRKGQPASKDYNGFSLTRVSHEKVTAAESRGGKNVKTRHEHFGHCTAEKIKHHVNIHRILVNKLVLKKKEML